MCSLITCNCISDPAFGPLSRDLRHSLSAAHASGTKNNHTRQAKLYIAFMLRANADPMYPHITPLLHYVQLLSNSFKSIASVKNYLSGAKTYVINAGGDPASFHSSIIPDLLRGVARLSSHIPSQAPTLDPQEVKAMCDALWTIGPDARVARAAVLFAFATFLRQSNFLATSTGRHHLLTRKDVLPSTYGLAIHLASAKTVLRTHPVVIPLHVIPGSRYCPVGAYLAARAATPADRDSPLFLTSEGRPLTPAGLGALMRVALTLTGAPRQPGVTVYILRRSGARAAAGAGAPREDVITHGTWRGNSIDAYVPRALFTSVPNTIKTILGSDTSGH